MNNFIATWEDISDVSQLEKLKNESYLRPIVLFKYSLTCGVSYAACDRLTEEWKSEGLNVGLYRVNVKEHRPLSMKIADDYDVIHQSPQVLVIQNGKCLKDISHFRISFSEIVPFLTSEIQTI